MNRFVIIVTSFLLSIYCFSIVQLTNLFSFILGGRVGGRGEERGRRGKEGVMKEKGEGERKVRMVRIS